MGRLEEIGALKLSERHMVVGCERKLGKVHRVSLVKWCMWQERIFVFGSGTTLGVVLFL